MIGDPSAFAAGGRAAEAPRPRAPRRLAAALLPVALLVAASPAPAHLETPFAGIGETIAQARTLVLVRTTAPSRTTPEGVETPVERIATIAGEAPPRFTLVHVGPHAHHLDRGEELLVPLTRSPAGRWLCVARTRAPLRVDRRSRRAALRFAAEWRRRARLDPAERLSEWIALTADPSGLARAAAFEALLAHAATLSAHVAPRHQNALGDLLVRPGVDEETRLAALRVLTVLGGPAAGPVLAERFPLIPSPRVRHLAAGVLARSDDPASRRALLRCARDAGPALAERCRRLLPRAPTPDSD